MSDSSQERPWRVTDHMPAVAAEFVEVCKAAGLPLDYQARTLPIAEKFTRSAPDHTERFGAYFGEVIRRETKGFWFDSEGVAMVYAGVEPYVDPCLIARLLLGGSKPEIGTTPIESTKAYCETIARLQRQWLDQSVLGSYPTMSSLRTAMAADAKTAGMVLALAQQAVLTAQLDWSEAISCSEDSLDSIEKILGAMHKLKMAPASKITDEQVDSLSKCMGVFVGEVIRRHYGGQWRATDGGSFEIPYPKTTIDPVARARKRIIDGPSENIPAYYSSMPRVVAS